MDNTAEMGHVATRPPTGMGDGGGGDFDLIRPPPSRRTSMESSNNIVRDVADVAALDPSMPLSVLIVEDTDVCEYAPLLQQVRMCFLRTFHLPPSFPLQPVGMPFRGPPTSSPSSPPLLFSFFSVVVLNPSFVLPKKNTKTGAKFLTMQLQRMNCYTHRAENGHVAVDLLTRMLPGTFDLVLMDLRMPVMDGLDATRLIKNELQMRDLPVVALTGEMIEWCRAECEGIGFDDFFQKPMKKDKLEALINRYRTARDGMHRVQENKANGGQSAGLVRTTSGSSVAEPIRRLSYQSTNNLNFNGSVNSNTTTLSNAKAGGSMMRRTTSLGQVDGHSNFGGQLGPRLSIDQQLQDPNLKIFANTMLAKSASRESPQGFRSNQQLDSIASALHGNGANASWEVFCAKGSHPARQTKQQSELDMPICPGRVNRVTLGESTSARSAHNAPNPTIITSKPLAKAPNNESPFAIARDCSVSTGQFSDQSRTTAMMPRNVTLQRIKEDDVIAKCKRGKDASWEVSQTKQQPDLTNIMSKMVTSAGLGCGNIRVASVQDFREATAAPNLATELLSKLATQTLGSQSGHRSVSTGQFYNRGEATGIIPRNVTLQRIKEEATVASGANASWDTPAGNGSGQHLAPMNNNHFLRMVANGGSNSAASSNSLLTMMTARQSQGNDAPKLGGAYSNPVQEFRATSSNPLLAMMAARQSQGIDAPKMGDVHSNPPKKYYIGDRVRREDMPKSSVHEMKMALMVSRLKVNDGAFVFLPDGVWCYSVVLRKDMTSLTFQVNEDGDTQSHDSLNAGMYVRILNDTGMAVLPCYNDDGWRRKLNDL